MTHDAIMAIDARAKPRAIRLIGVKLIFALRRAGYTTKSINGTKMTMEMGLRFWMMSLGTPLSSITAA